MKRRQKRENGDVFNMCRVEIATVGFSVCGDGVEDPGVFAEIKAKRTLMYRSVLPKHKVLQWV